MMDKLKQSVGLTARSQQDASIIMQLESGEITIGRAADNDVVINEITVSGHHARVFTYMSVSYIEDLGSKNGTYINQRRIQKHVLHSGDVVCLGQFCMVMEDSHAETVSATRDSVTEQE